jgi:hypothetical protein
MSALLSSFFGSSASAKDDTTPVDVVVAQPQGVSTSIQDVRDAPPALDEPVLDAPVTSGDQPAQGNTGSVPVPNVTADPKADDKPAEVVLEATNSSGEILTKTFSSLKDFSSFMEKLGTPDCPCPTCTRKRQLAAGAQSAPADKPDAPTGTAPTNDDMPPLVDDDEPEPVVSQVAEPQDDRSNRLNDNDAIGRRLDAAFGPCPCPNCTARRARDTGLESINNKDASTSKKLAGLDLLSLLLGGLKNKPKKNVDYTDAFGYGRRNVSGMPLLNPKIRVTTATGSSGQKPSFEALAKSTVRDADALGEEDVYKYFDVDLVEIFTTRSSPDNTVIQARVRLESDTRTARVKHAPSIHGPALVALLKWYCDETYPGQTGIRFHPDGFGYDVYGTADSTRQQLMEEVD